MAITLSEIHEAIAEAAVEIVNRNPHYWGLGYVTLQDLWAYGDFFEDHVTQAELDEWLLQLKRGERCAHCGVVAADICDDCAIERNEAV